jgi:hypothetical protein
MGDGRQQRRRKRPRKFYNVFNGRLIMRWSLIFLNVFNARVRRTRCLILFGFYALREIGQGIGQRGRTPK